MSEMLL